MISDNFDSLSLITDCMIADTFAITSKEITIDMTLMYVRFASSPSTVKASMRGDIFISNKVNIIAIDTPRSDVIINPKIMDCFVTNDFALMMEYTKYLFLFMFGKHRSEERRVGNV